MLNDGNLLGASDHPNGPVVSDKYPKSNPRGVAVRPPDYQRFAYRHRMVIATSRANDVRALALTQLGKRFDNGSLKDMISDAFPGVRNWRLDDCWFCAELVVWAMETAGVWGRQLNWPKNRVSPTDLLMVMLTDVRWVNVDTFWDPVPGLKLGPKEK